MINRNSSGITTMMLELAGSADFSLFLQDLEAEFMKPHSTVLADIGLALLKFVSSHRGLTYVI